MRKIKRSEYELKDHNSTSCNGCAFYVPEDGRDFDACLVSGNKNFNCGVTEIFVLKDGNKLSTTDQISAK